MRSRSFAPGSTKRLFVSVRYCAAYSLGCTVKAYSRPTPSRPMAVSFCAPGARDSGNPTTACQWSSWLTTITRAPLKYARGGGSLAGASFTAAMPPGTGSARGSSCAAATPGSRTSSHAALIRMRVYLLHQTFDLAARQARPHARARGERGRGTHQRARVRVPHDGIAALEGGERAQGVERLRQAREPLAPALEAAAHVAQKLRGEMAPLKLPRLHPRAGRNVPQPCGQLGEQRVGMAQPRLLGKPQAQDRGVQTLVQVRDARARMDEAGVQPVEALIQSA